MSSIDLAHRAATGIGVARALTGVFLAAVPGKGAEAWIGRSSPQANYLVRAIGVRDLTIGAGVLWAVREGESARPWLLASAAADAGDAIFGATMLSGDRRIKTVLMAGTFAVLGFATAKVLAE